MPAFAFFFVKVGEGGGLQKFCNTRTINLEAVFFFKLD